MITFDVKLENYAPKSKKNSIKPKTQKHYRDGRRRAGRQPYPSPVRYMLLLARKTQLAARADMCPRTYAKAASQAVASCAPRARKRRSARGTARVSRAVRCLRWLRPVGRAVWEAWKFVEAHETRGQVRYVYAVVVVVAAANVQTREGSRTKG